MDRIAASSRVESSSVGGYRPGRPTIGRPHDGDSEARSGCRLGQGIGQKSCSMGGIARGVVIVTRWIMGDEVFGLHFELQDVAEGSVVLILAADPKPGLGSVHCQNISAPAINILCYGYLCERPPPELIKVYDCKGDKVTYLWNVPFLWEMISRQSLPVNPNASCRCQQSEFDRDEVDQRSITNSNSPDTLGGPLQSISPSPVPRHILWHGT
ncbi:unnamed protein product [Diplocarpon coronariae]